MQRVRRPIRACADCRRLFLRNYEVRINIGVHEFEKTAPAARADQRRRLYVPLAVSTPARDRLDEVVDYDFIRRTVGRARRRARAHPPAGDAVRRHARAIARAPAVRAVRVSTEKPDVYPDCDAVGVEVFASRKDH